MGRFRVGLVYEERIYSLYSIEVIVSIESPYKTWKLNVCVCFIIELFLNVLFH